MRKDQTNAMIGALGSVSSVPGVQKQDILDRGLEFSRASGIDPSVFDTLTAPLVNGKITPDKFGDYLQAQQLGISGYNPVAGAPVQTPYGVSATQTPAAQFLRERRQAGGAAQPIGLTPQEQTTQTQKVSAGVGEQVGDLKVSSDYLTNRNNYNQIVSLLDKAGPNGTGITTEERDNLKNIAVQAHLIDPNATDVVEELRKYYSRIVGSKVNGTGTDYQLLNTVSGNPNLNVNQAPASHLSKVDLGLMRLKQGMSMELGSAAPQDYPYKRAQFINNQDVNASTWDMQSGAQQRKYIAGLFPKALHVGQMDDNQLTSFLNTVKPGEAPKYDKFKYTHDIMKKYGLYDLSTPNVGP